MYYVVSSYDNYAETHKPLDILQVPDGVTSEQVEKFAREYYKGHTPVLTPFQSPTVLGLVERPVLEVTNA